MDYVRKSDVEKISALTNKGFDPNYIDRSSGGSISISGLLHYIASHNSFQGGLSE